MEEAQAHREKLKNSFKATRSHIEALQFKLNKHNERLQDARAKYNELHEEQLQISSNMQKLKHLKEKQEDLYTREVSVGETVEKLRKNLADAEDKLHSGIRVLEKTKVCFFRSNCFRVCFRELLYVIIAIDYIIIYTSFFLIL